MWPQCKPVMGRALYSIILAMALYLLVDEDSVELLRRGKEGVLQADLAGRDLHSSTGSSS